LGYENKVLRDDVIPHASLGSEDRLHDQLGGGKNYAPSPA
jgi:hypothetical protein